MCRVVSVMGVCVCLIWLPLFVCWAMTGVCVVCGFDEFLYVWCLCCVSFVFFLVFGLCLCVLFV